MIANGHMNYNMWAMSGEQWTLSGETSNKLGNARYCVPIIMVTLVNNIEAQLI